MADIVLTNRVQPRQGSREPEQFADAKLTGDKRDEAQSRGAQIRTAFLLDEDNPDRVLATQQREGNRIQHLARNIWRNGSEEQREAFGNGSEGKGRTESPPQDWWSDALETLGSSLANMALSRSK